MTPRQEHIFIREFILSGKHPGHLLCERKQEKALLIKEYIHTGPPEELAMTDPVAFSRLRNAITKLILNGW